MNRVTHIVHMPTLVALVIASVVCTAAILAIPHRTEGFGRMNAHQGYAQVGKFASLGLIDRTLVDWYMLGPTLEENIRPYNKVVYTSVGILSHVFFAWCLALASVVGACKERLYRDKGFAEQTGRSLPVPRFASHRTLSRDVR